MNHGAEPALGVDVTAAGSVVQVAAVTEAGRQADAIPGEPPVPGSIEWPAEDGTAVPSQRERTWQLLQVRIGLAAGMDPLPALIGLRRHGSTRDEIARATGMTPRSAQERGDTPWSAGVASAT